MMLLPALLACSLLAVTAAVTPVPQLPDALTAAASDSDTNSDIEAFISLWQRAITAQEEITPDLALDDSPETIVALHSNMVVNFVPHDAPSPLYTKVPHHVALRTRVLRDLMTLEKVDPEDPQLKDKDGYQAINLNNNTLTFKDELGSLSVNGLPVLSVRQAGGVTVYVVLGYLFDHFQAVQNGTSELYKQYQEGSNSPFF